MLPQGMLAYQSPLHLHLVAQKQNSLSILMIRQNIDSLFVWELILFFHEVAKEYSRRLS
jgi:hypothetical protein